MLINEVMTRDFDYVWTSDTIREAAEKMKILNVGSMPVFDGDDAAGIVTDRDITIRSAAEGKDPNKTKVGDVMTQDVISCYEDMDLKDAANLMEENKVRRLLVKDRNEKIVGILSLGDIAVSSSDGYAASILTEIDMARIHH